MSQNDEKKNPYSRVTQRTLVQLARERAIRDQFAEELYAEERESMDRAGCPELFALILWVLFGAACWWAIAEAWALFC